MKKIFLAILILLFTSTCSAEDLLINDKVYVESTSIKVYNKNKIFPEKEAEICILFSTTMELNKSNKTIHYVVDVQKNTYKSIEYVETRNNFNKTTSIHFSREDSNWLKLEDNSKVSYIYIIALQYIATHHHQIVEQS